MISGFAEMSTQLYSFPKNKLVFKQPTPIHFSQSSKIVSKKKKLLDMMGSDTVQSSKNLLQKRVQIRNKFETGEAKTRKQPLASTFKVIGRSESTEKLRNSTRMRRNLTLVEIKTSKNRRKFPCKIPLRVPVPGMFETSLNTPSRLTRRVVPIVSNSLNLTEIEDHDEDIMIKSRIHISYYKMNQMKKHSNKMFNIDENVEVIDKKLVPPLKICASPKAFDSNCESLSLTYRMKKRNQVHRSLDFNLTASLMLTPKVIKADHSIVPQITPKASTYRKISFSSTVTVNKRMVSKNLLLDAFPV